MIRIAVTGPESTGKSWLAENLAAHYHCAWVPEYAREFLAGTKGEYTYNDILTIARGQFAGEQQKALEPGSFLFCDTDFVVTRIWCKVKYGKVHPWIRTMSREHRYDLYLLCNVDLPWEYDPLREHPQMRQKLFELYTAELKKLDANFRVVSGSGEERLVNAVGYVEELLANR